MSKIYPEQHFTMTLESSIALSAATTLEIWYYKPSSTTPVKGFTATASGTTASADFTPTENTEDDAGMWRFLIYAVIAGKTLFGEVFKQKVTPLGE